MPVKSEPGAGDVLTVGEAAPLLRRSKQGLYRAIRLGHLPPGVVFKVGRDVYVSRSRLLEWRDAGGSMANEARGAA